MLSPLELLLPGGVARGVVALGDGCPPALAPQPPDADGSTVDLVVLAPSRAQQRDRRWVQQALEVVASRLSPTGIAYLIPAGSQIRRELGAAGLRPSGAMLHIPNIARSRYLVPVGTTGEHYALSGQLPMGRLKRVAALALRERGRRTVAPTGAIHRRDPGVPLARWLFELEGSPRPAGSVLVAMSRAGEGGAIVYRFVADDAIPDAVAKVSQRADDELQALRTVARRASRAGVRVPTVLSSGALGSTPLVLQSALRGRSAALLAERKLLAPREIQDRLAGWLERWGRASAHVRELGPGDLERFVLSPAEAIAAHTAGLGPYGEYLGKLCSRLDGRKCPFVPGHCDLTLANVVVDGSTDLGIVDWEKAVEEALPLMDFFYAGVDAVAATEGYADRPGAFASCFSAGSEQAAYLDGLRRRIGDAFEIDGLVQELCFHACWLHHAANEAAGDSGPHTGPFVTILKTIAREPHRFTFSDQAR